MYEWRHLLYTAVPLTYDQEIFVKEIKEISWQINSM
jgi:hypothetical protein